MKNLLIYLSIFLLIASCKKDSGDKNNCNYSYIIAGDSLSTCYEIISIDSYGNSYGMYELDVNNDDSIDLTFRTYRHVASHGTSVHNGCYLQIENPSLELSREKDSVSAYGEFVCLHNLMDTIGDDEEWLSYETGRVEISEMDYLLHEDPWTGHVSIVVGDSVNVNFSQKYIGIRIKEPSFTSYYWLKLSVRDCESVYKEEFGRPKR